MAATSATNGTTHTHTHTHTDSSHNHALSEGGQDRRSDLVHSVVLFAKGVLNPLGGGKPTWSLIYLHGFSCSGTEYLHKYANSQPQYTLPTCDRLPRWMTCSNEQTLDNV
eukprot:227291-Amphidinium_carterae.3